MLLLCYRRTRTSYGDFLQSWSWEKALLEPLAFVSAYASTIISSSGAVQILLHFQDITGCVGTVKSTKLACGT